MDFSSVFSQSRGRLYSVGLSSCVAGREFPELRASYDKLGWYIANRRVNHIHRIMFPIIVLVYIASYPFSGCL